MKITLFSHSAVIGVDAPLCHKSKSYVDELIASCEADMLPPDSFRRPAARLRPRRGSVEVEGKELLKSASRETEAHAAISADEMQANVGLATTHGEVRRARAKVKAYPNVHDQLATVAYGRWYDSSAIKVVAIQ